jgi:cell division septation protein DedD
MMGEKDDDFGDPAIDPEDQPEKELAEDEQEEEADDDDVWFRPDTATQPERDDMPDYQFKDDNRRSLLIAGSIIVVFLFGGVLWYLYYEKNKGGEVPLITADATPVKTAPENPGGMEVENQDRLIFDKVSGETTPLKDAVQPAPEQPIDSATDETTLEQLIRETEPKPGAPTETKTAAATVPTSPVNGAYIVQLGAFGSQSAAQTAWSSLSGRYADILKPFHEDIQRATLSDGRTVYRLRAGYFTTKAEAENLCGQLKAKGQDCLAAAR